VKRCGNDVEYPKPAIYNWHKKIKFFWNILVLKRIIDTQKHMLKVL